MNRRVVVKRSLFGRDRLHELFVDDRLAMSRLQPFTQAEIDAAKRIGPPIDPLAVKGEWPMGTK